MNNRTEQGERQEAITDAKEILGEFFSDREAEERFQQMAMYCEPRNRQDKGLAQCINVTLPKGATLSGVRFYNSGIMSGFVFTAGECRVVGGDNVTTPDEAPDIVGLRGLLAKEQRALVDCRESGTQTAFLDSCINASGKLNHAMQAVLPKLLDELEALRAAQVEWTIESAVGQQQLDAMAAENGRLREALWANQTMMETIIRTRSTNFKEIADRFVSNRAALTQSRGEGA